MACSAEENQIIDKIDFDRAGITYEALDEASAYYRRLSKFCIWAVEKTVLEAEKFPELTDAALSMKVASFEFVIGKEEGDITRLVNETGLSRRGLRALESNDTRRIQYFYHLTRISSLKKQRWEMQQCANSRKFIRDRSDWVNLYTIVRGYKNRHNQLTQKLKRRYRIN